MHVLSTIWIGWPGNASRNNKFAFSTDKIKDTNTFGSNLFRFSGSLTDLRFIQIESNLETLQKCGIKITR